MAAFTVAQSGPSVQSQALPSRFHAQTVFPCVRAFRAASIDASREESSAGLEVNKLQALAGTVAAVAALSASRGSLRKSSGNHRTMRRCGILAILRSKMPEDELRALGLKLSKRLRHRGPDWNGLHIQTHEDGTRSLLAHERLAIVDPSSGKQPLFDTSGKVCSTVNGEIYNHMQLREQLSPETVKAFRTQSDCEPLTHLYKKVGDGLAQELDGIFSFVISEEGSGDYYIARDPIGVTPLYYGTGKDGEIFVASEMKALHDCCENFQIFPPGHHLSSGNAEPVRYFKPNWLDAPPSKSPAADGPSPVALQWAENIEREQGLNALREAFEKAVEKRLMADVPYGVLLSGGLDSSLVSAVAVKKHRERLAKRTDPSFSVTRSDGLISVSLEVPDVPGLMARVTDVISTLGFSIQTASCQTETADGTCAKEIFEISWRGNEAGLGFSEIDAIHHLEWRLREELSRLAPTDESANSVMTDKLHSFSVGLEGAPDLIAARKVADYLGTSHHKFTFTVQEGIDAVRDVIYHLETHDVTTIRASVPMYFLTRKIKAMGVKMVLSGEGADEIFGGYLYFHKAPNGDEFHEELKRKLAALHMYDCLRANKATHAFGLEARVPFLDKAFLEVAMNIDPRVKMPRENPRNIEKWSIRQAFDGYLPDEILWRQKEQFSDGVGYSWIDGLKEFAEKAITTEQIENAHVKFPEDPPLTKEAYYYRQIFEEYFPEKCCKATVPGGPSIACSTAAAIEWDESFKNNADQSGRSVIGVHVDGKEFEDAKQAVNA